jgi:hypothetical protein
MMVTCKKWHVAKRLVDRVRSLADLPAIDYLFNEASTDAARSGRHPVEPGKAHPPPPGAGADVVRLLADRPADLLHRPGLDRDLMQDFYSDKAKVRLLEIECDFTDDYLIGHAPAGSVWPATARPQETIDRLLPTIRYDVRFESDRIREFGFPGFQRIRQSASVDENTVALAEFLDIPVEKAREIAATEYIFSWTDRHGPGPTTRRTSLPASCAAKSPTRPWLETPHTLAFHDIHPQAPVHVLVIPKGAYVDFDHFAAEASAEEIVDFHRCAAQGLRHGGGERRRLPRHHQFRRAWPCRRCRITTCTSWAAGFSAGWSIPPDSGRRDTETADCGRRSRPSSLAARPASKGRDPVGADGPRDEFSGAGRACP